MGGGLESRCTGRVYGADGVVSRTAPSALYTRPTQRPSRPPPIQKLVLYNSDAGFVAIVKSCRIMLNGVHCRFVDLKKLSY